MKSIMGYLAKAGFKTVIGRWSWGIAGTVLLTLSAVLMQSCARLNEAGNARIDIAAKLAEKELAYNKQAKKIIALESTISRYKCSAGWTERRTPDGTVEYRCEGEMTGDTSSTRYADTTTEPRFAPVEVVCPPEFYPLGLDGDVMAGKKSFGWKVGPSYEWASGWSGKIGFGQLNGGMIYTGGLQVRFAKKNGKQKGGN